MITITSIGPRQLRCLELMADQTDSDGDRDHIWLIDSGVGGWGVRVSVDPGTLEGDLRSLGHLARALLEIDGPAARSARALSISIRLAACSSIPLGLADFQAWHMGAEEWLDQRLAVWP